MIYRFGKLFEIIDGDRGKNYPKENDFFDDGYCLFLNAGNVTKNGWSFEKNTFITKEKDEQLRKGRVSKGNTVLTTRGTVGNVAFYDNKVKFNHVRINSGMVILKTKNNRIVTDEFIYYLVKSPLVLKTIELFCSGSAQPQLPIKDFIRIKANIPLLDTQKRVVEMLSVFDCLIEINKKRIKVLEQMAENLYKEWFVRFRFPGHENAEFENGIPKGWTYCRLKELFEIKYGKDHKSIAEGEIPIFGSGGIMRYGDKAIYSNESVLIPRKGTLNNILYVNEPFWTVDTMFYTILLKPNFAKYAYYTLANVDMESYNSGAALPSMTTDILYHLRILVPDNRTLKLFDEFISDINTQKKKIEVINNNLTKQRDLLLPRLMSGKLEV